MPTICRMCKNDRTLIKAHIIPERFFPLDEKRTSKLYTNIPNSYRKKSPNGVYDQTILCDECEKSLSIYDGYGAEVLIKRLENYKHIKHNGKVIAAQDSDIDYPLLKLFIISVLW